MSCSCLRPLTLLDLVAANDAQLAAHSVIMLRIFYRRQGGFADRSVWITLVRGVLAAAGMAFLAAAAWFGVERLGLPPSLAQRTLSVAVPGAVGLVAYFWLAERLQISELGQAVSLIRQRFKL